MTRPDPQTEQSHGQYAISYLLIRQAIGLVGFFLTILCIVVAAISDIDTAIQPSISHYYYSAAHIVFLAALCTIGALLGTYRGRLRWENRVSNIAGIAALGVAAIPTKFMGFIGSPTVVYCNYKSWMNGVHYLCAAVLFILFAIFCLVFFQRNDKTTEGESMCDPVRKRKLNRIYTACGIIIIASISIIFGAFLLEAFKVIKESWTFLTITFETTSLLAFSVSWILKGSESWNNSEWSVVNYLARLFR